MNGDKIDGKFHFVGNLQQARRLVQNLDNITSTFILDDICIYISKMTIDGCNDLVARFFKNAMSIHFNQKRRGNFGRRYEVYKKTEG